MLDVHAIIKKHYDPQSELYDLLLLHSALVTQKARQIAIAFLKRQPTAGIDLEFLTEAAMLHDIGIQNCDASDIHCHGPEPYIRHGFLGHEILKAEGLPRHALVCERHTGAGITRAEVTRWSLPIPERDYLPESIEEKIICIADKFFRKTDAWPELRLKDIRENLTTWGEDVLVRWDGLVEEFL